MSDNAIRFWVPGVPAPGGSKRGFVYKAFDPKRGQIVNRASVTEDCKRSKDWRATVAMCASEAIKDPLAGAVELRIAFCLLRPKGHYRTGRNAGALRSSAPAYPITKPDATKLLRSTEDALKGIAWQDDSQVVRQTVTKEYTNRTGAMITVWPMEDVNA